MKKLILLLTIFTFFGCEKDKSTSETESIIVTNNEDEVVEDLGFLSYDSARTKLKWTAYKTPEKVAVHGSFDSIVVKNSSESVIPEEVLEGATFKIYTPSLTTGDESRDAKIIGLFFNNLEDNNIHGSFGKFENETVPVEIVMNDQLLKKDFKYTLENKKLIITGVIDIINDFKAEKGFNLLSEACSSLHLNKTWTDVSIEIISDLEKDAE